MLPFLFLVDAYISSVLAKWVIILAHFGHLLAKQNTAFGAKMQFVFVGVSQ